MTPETLTDAMVREFYDSLDPDVEDEAVLRILCSSALMPSYAMSVQAYPLAKTSARKRICDAINARGAKP